MGDVVTIRQLRNEGGDVIARVARGESLTVTRDGDPVAVLQPLPRPAAHRDVLIERRRRLPHVDPQELRRNVDAVIDPTL